MGLPVRSICKRSEISVLALILFVSFSSLVYGAASESQGNQLIQSEISPKGLKVDAIEIEGEELVAESKIKAVLKTKVGQVIPADKVEAKVKEDLVEINKLGLFSDQTARFAGSKDGIKIIFEVIENPKIVGIVFKGNSLVQSKELVPLLKVKIGEVLNTNTLQADLERIVKYYLDKGGSIRISDVDTDKDGRLVVSIVERRISKIEIKGNVKTKEYVIRRELSSKEGQLLDFNKIRAEQRRLLNLGYFEEMSPKFTEGSTPDDVIYTIELKERQTGTGTGGLGYSAADGLLGYVEVSEQNLMGRGQKLNLRLELGSKGSRTYELGFTEPWLDSKRTSLGLNVYNRELLRTESINSLATTYSEKRQGGDITLGRPLDLDTNLTLKLKSERTKNIGKTSADQSNLDNSQYKDNTTNSITLGYNRDTRDSFFNPTSGYQVSGSTEFGLKALGGDNEFQKVQGQASTYFKVFNKHTIAVRVSAGKTFHKESLASQERFRIGGADNLRGYDYGEMTGDTMMFGNLEYRFPIVKALSGVVFADTGTAFDNSDFKLNKMGVGAGLGIRVDTPLGLLRLDYGVHLENGKPVGKPYFSIGQAF